MKSNVDRTLVSCNFKEKRMSGSQLRVTELIAEEKRMQAKKERREKRRLHQAEKSFFRRDRYDAQRQKSVCVGDQRGRGIDMTLFEHEQRAQGDSDD